MSSSSAAEVDSGGLTARIQPSVPYVVAVGQLLLLGALAPGLDGQPPLLATLVGEGLLAGLLGATLIGTEPRAPALAGFGLAGLTIAIGSLLAAGQTPALWPVAGVLVGIVAAGGYLLYRIELLRLGLVGGDSS